MQDTTAASSGARKSTRYTRDPDIRSVLMRELAHRFSDPTHDLIVEEFGCKGARIDIAVINGSLHGFEIKSDRDSLDRLDAQAAQYGKIFDFMTLVCGHRLLTPAMEALPLWWGIKAAKWEDEIVVLQDIRKPEQNRSQEKAALARMLWKDEALRCLRRYGYKNVTSRNSAEQVWNEAAIRLELKALADEARLAIKSRGGSGFEKRSTQDGDSSTIESIALADYCSGNLAWLLSQQSLHRPD